MRQFCMVEDYGDGTISYWLVDLAEADRNEIDRILEKYAAEGFSCRGLPEPILSDLADILTHI